MFTCMFVIKVFDDYVFKYSSVPLSLSFSFGTPIMYMLVNFFFGCAHSLQNFLAEGLKLSHSSNLSQH